MIKFIQSKIDEKLRDEYSEKGYAVLPKILDDENIDKLKIAFERIFADDYDRELYPFDRVYKHGLDNELKAFSIDKEKFIELKMEW